ncbi:MAG: DNA polymerase III subunit beta [Aeromonas sp.]
MQLEISREALLRPLQLVSGAIGSRPTLPILGNVLLQVQQGVLSLTGTDLEVEMIGQVHLQGDSQEGRTTVPARKLFDICRGLPEGAQIRLTTEGERLIIRSSRSRFNLSTLPAAEYPNIEDWESVLEFDLSQLELKKLIDATQFSMASQDVRYYLNGMLFETEGQGLRSVATDGHRLATCRREILQQSVPEHQVILPRKGVLELVRLLESEDKPVRLQIGRNNLRAVLDGFIFTSKLVDGRFPDWRRVIPRNSDKAIIAGREDLRHAFARAAILSNEKFRGVRLNLAQHLLRITANNPEQEEAEELLDVDYAAGEMEIGFNVSYVLDVLNTLKCEQIRISLSDAISSAIIEDFDSQDAQYVVMPMRI